MFSRLSEVICVLFCELHLCGICLFSWSHLFSGLCKSPFIDKAISSKQVGLLTLSVQASQRLVLG